MAFKKRLELLLQKAQKDYAAILFKSNQYEDDVRTVEAMAEEITVTKAILSYMQTSLEENPSDVAALLFYDRPLTAFYEDFKEKDIPLWGGLLEPLDSFITSTKHHIHEVLNQWDKIPLDEVAKAEDFVQMEKQIEQYDSEREQNDDLEQ